MSSGVSFNVDPTTIDSDGGLSALAAAKALTSARQNTESQIVLIIFCPCRTFSRRNPPKFWRFKGKIGSITLRKEQLQKRS